MSNEPNKPIPAQELTEKELEGVVGGAKFDSDVQCYGTVSSGTRDVTNAN